MVKKKEENGEHSKWFGGAIINATAFVGGSYLTKYVTGDQNSVVEERKRHDLAVEKYKNLHVRGMRRVTQSF